jgi:hypothetical protein
VEGACSAHRTYSVQYVLCEISSRSTILRSYTFRHSRLSQGFTLCEFNIHLCRVKKHGRSVLSRHRHRLHNSILQQPCYASLSCRMQPVITQNDDAADMQRRRSSFFGSGTTTYIQVKCIIFQSRYPDHVTSICPPLRLPAQFPTYVADFGPLFVPRLGMRKREFSAAVVVQVFRRVAMAPGTWRRQEFPPTTLLSSRQYCN